jgi:hypothetical protein
MSLLDLPIYVASFDTRLSRYELCLINISLFDYLMLDMYPRLAYSPCLICSVEPIWLHTVKTRDI